MNDELKPINFFNVETLLDRLENMRIYGANEVYVTNGDLIAHFIINDETLSFICGDGHVYKNNLIMRPFFSISGKNDGKQQLTDFEKFGEDVAVCFTEEALQIEYIYRIAGRQLITDLFEDIHQIEQSKNQDVLKAG